MRHKFVASVPVLSLLMVVVMAVPAHAWHALAVIKKACIATTGQFQLTPSVTNPPEKWNSVDWKMVIDGSTFHVGGATFHPYVPGTQVPFGQTLDAPKPMLVAGNTTGSAHGVIDEHWTNGVDNRAYTSVKAAIKLFGDCKIPRQVPGLSQVFIVPQCGATQAQVDLTTLAGNTTTHIAFEIQPSTNVKAFDMKPLTNVQVMIPITPGVPTTIKILQDGKLFHVYAPFTVAKAPCGSSTSKTPNPPTQKTTPITDLAFTGFPTIPVTLGALLVIAIGLALGSRRRRRIKHGVHPMFA